MKQTIILVSLILTIVVTGALSAYLYAAQQEAVQQARVQETAAADARATVVQLFDQQNQLEGTRVARIATQEAAIDGLQTQLDVLVPAATAAAEAGPPPTATVNPADEDAPPQVRIRLRDRENIRLPDEPIDIIASAAHPIGIAVLNITANGETIISDSPLDPRMNIVTARWTPPGPGTYTISAVATTIRGRAGTPVSVEVVVVDGNDQTAVTEALLSRIAAHVEEIRGRDAAGNPIQPNFITAADLQANISGDLLREYTPETAARDVLVLSMFDFIDEDYPLYESLTELYGQAIAGYYEPEDKTLFVIDDDGQLNEEERLTYAHEYLHALQDIHFGLGFLEDDTISKDRKLALRSLGEGEAELLEFLYQSRGYLTGEQAADSNPVFPTPRSADAPNFLLSDFNFPYVRGFQFVYRYFEQDAFTAVDNLWDNPPQSSEHIIHPERYDSGDNPVLLVLPDLGPVLGDEWTLLEEDVFGEFYLRQWLSQWLDEDTLDTAATGWGGDRYAVYHNPQTEARVLALAHVWDTAADQAEFTAAFTEWATQRTGRDGEPTAADAAVCWTGPDTFCLFDTVDGTLVVRAADQPTATAVGQEIITRP